MDRATLFQELQQRLCPAYCSSILPLAALYTCLVTCGNGETLTLYLMASGQLRYEWAGLEGTERVYCIEEALINHLEARLEPIS